MSLAHLVRILGRGPGRARSLTEAEASEAMGLILAGNAAPEAVGALFMLMRYRGESPGEIAGFVRAMREETADWATCGAALDWPSYAAGRSRGAPYFVLSARLIAAAGYPVLLHGWNGANQGPSATRPALASVGIPTAATPKAARAALATQAIVYVPLEDLSPRLFDLIRLRDVLGLRSPVNTCLRSLNPSRAPAAVQGVFHPVFRGLQQQAASLLGDTDQMVLKGGGGEFERNPAKPIQLFGLKDGVDFRDMAPALRSEHRRLAADAAKTGDLAALWSGRVDDTFAVDTVTGTAALALIALGAEQDHAAAQSRAEALWADRNPAVAA
ncbi:MAG: glycosyl transferase family protein [Pseudomonadota bacterium]